VPSNLKDLTKPKKQRRRTKFSWIRLSQRVKTLSFIAVFALVGTGYVLYTHAATNQDEVCSVGSAGTPLFPCLNAWNGGPGVNTYSPGVSHEYFEYVGVSKGGTSYIEIKYVPTGTCVGDAGNSESNARAVMNDPCGNPNTGAGAGWGTLFTQLVGSCPNGTYMRNVHWNGGYLSYANWPQQSNNLAWYLNTQAGYCMGAFFY
jgi:hypothetical protein